MKIFKVKYQLFKVALNKSKTAVEKYENSSNEETQKLEEISNLIAGYEKRKKTITVEDLQPGDFVNYSAGTWKPEEITALTNAGLYAGESLPTNSTPYKFGGFKAGDSKDSSITTNDLVNTYSSGWRVLSVENGKINIVHAGTPEAYYHLYQYGTNNGYISEYILKSKIKKYIMLN